LNIDVASNRKMLQLVLKKKGFTFIDQCGDGKEAMAFVALKGHDYYEVIFMDNLMPTIVSISRLLVASMYMWINIYCLL